MATAPKTSYDPVAKTLHWLIGIGIICMLAVGWIMVGLPNGADKFTIIQLHKSVGITILLLALFRLFWRFRHPAPPLPIAMPGWEKFGARASHITLYVLIILMPFVGWVMVSASPYNLPTLLYGVIPWPHLPVLPELTNKKEISHLAADIHGYLAYVIAAVVALHAAAALKHHFIDRDDVLTRMAPGPMIGWLNRLRRKP